MLLSVSFPHVCLLVRLSVCLPACRSEWAMSVGLFACLAVRLPTCPPVLSVLSVCLPGWERVCLTLRNVNSLPACLSARRSVCLPVRRVWLAGFPCLPACLPFCLSARLSVCYVLSISLPACVFLSTRLCSLGSGEKNRRYSWNNSRWKVRVRISLAPRTIPGTF